MNEAIVIQWLQGNWPIWGAFILGFIPTLIAEVKGRPKTRWYLYSLACALVAWPLVTLPTIHALFLRRRNGMSEESVGGGAEPTHSQTKWRSALGSMLSLARF